MIEFAGAEQEGTGTMPLSKAAPRRHLHTREVVCRGYERDDGLWDIEATLTDSKSYSMPNQDRGGIAAGEALHGMAIRLTVDDDLVVRAVEAVTDHSPFTQCPAATPAYERLVGSSVGAGWRKAVTAAVGGVQGCTHLTDVLLGPLAVATLHTVHGGKALRRREAGEEEAPVTRRPGIIDTCHALASDGPVVKREWPAFHTGT